jgi:hypothetical protein
MIEKRRAVLITFSVKTDRFQNRTERNRFYKELYGWKQTVKKQEKKYVYERDGLLDEIPHIKVDQSLFIIMREHMRRMQEFLDEWEDKIKWDMFDVLLNDEQQKLLKRCFDDE